MHEQLVVLIDAIVAVAKLPSAPAIEIVVSRLAGGTRLHSKVAVHIHASQSWFDQEKIKAGRASVHVYSTALVAGSVDDWCEQIREPFTEWCRALRVALESDKGNPAR